MVQPHHNDKTHVQHICARTRITLSDQHIPQAAMSTVQPMPPRHTHHYMPQWQRHQGPKQTLATNIFRPVSHALLAWATMLFAPILLVEMRHAHRYQSVVRIQEFLWPIMECFMATRGSLTIFIERVL
ncbi:hypothetical protein ACJBU6_00783 [Exserohilum turcicum]